MVVQLPQDPVRDPVVVAGEQLGRDVDEPGAACGLHLGRRAGGGDLAVTLGHRRGEPRRVGFEQHAGDRRHEPARAAVADELPVGIATERDRTSVGRHDERRLERRGLRLRHAGTHSSQRLPNRCRSVWCRADRGT